MRTQKALQLGSGIKTQEHRLVIGLCLEIPSSVFLFFFSFLDGNFGKFIVGLCYLRLFLMLVKFIGD